MPLIYYELFLIIVNKRKRKKRMKTEQIKVKNKQQHNIAELDQFLIGKAFKAINSLRLESSDVLGAF